MAFIFVHRSVEENIGNALVNCGIPSERILFDCLLEIDKGNRRDADVAVMAEDGKTLLFQFEVKKNVNGLDDVYRRARRSLRGLWLQHRCFVATDNDGCELITEVKSDVEPKWIDLADAQAFSNLIGRYEIASGEAVEKRIEGRHQVVAEECKSFVNHLFCVGGLLLILAVIGELCGMEFSWKVYCLGALVLILNAAARGLTIDLKWGDKSIKVLPKRDGDVNKKD